MASLHSDLLRPICVVLAVLTAGCAPAYHSYRCGSIRYDYCPPAPPPYITYCGCPTPAASGYAIRTVSSKATGGEGTEQTESGSATSGQTNR